jgi:hypothetical protein
MWALILLAVQAARANPCIRIRYATDENGAKTVSKSFAITARSPEACKKNQFSGLGPTKAYALEVSILKVLNEKRNASSYTTRKCRDRYFPRLLERNDPKRAFVQSYDGEPLIDVATAAKNTVLHDGKLTLIDFDIATLFGFPRTRELQKSYADLLTELHGEVCTANTGAAARAAAARARWNRPVT